jgi:hypothetical protein
MHRYTCIVEEQISSKAEKSSFKGLGKTIKIVIIVGAVFAGV